MKRVEQVDIEGNVFFDYDTKLSSKSLFECININFPEIHKNEDGMICGQYNGRKFTIRMKNVTYLGHPHPLYKKRIQIGNDLQSFYNESIAKGYTPLLIGVYTCGKNTLFCDFNIEDFIEKKANNSSAHVSTRDLVEATVDAYYYKEDANGNKITVFRPHVVTTYLSEKLGIDKEDSYEYRFEEDFEHSLVSDISYKYNIDYEIEKIEKNVMDFFAKINRRWFGIECYKLMIEANYRNKFQPEWPGFFLEYAFEEYLNKNNLNSLIKYAQDKTKAGIDLDLFFPTICMYGDLKAHSSHSNAIQGNDWKTILGLVNNPFRDNHVYYIVCEHDTEKDSLYDYEVTQFWNTVQGKSNLMSYSKRMKNHVVLTHAYIFDINSRNKMFLSKFKQGLNSNGKPRDPKIMIECNNFSEFILAESNL